METMITYCSHDDDNVDSNDQDDNDSGSGECWKTKSSSR